MAGMTFLRSSNGHADKTARKITSQGSKPSDVAGSIWQWINGVANGVNSLIGGPIASGFKTLVTLVGSVFGAVGDVINAIERLGHYIGREIPKLLARLEAYLKHWVQAQMRSTVRMLLRIIFITTQTVLSVAMHAVRTERRERIRAVKRAEHLAKMEVRALHRTIEREAVSGYMADHKDRVSLIIRLLEFAATRVPAVRALVGDLSTALLDLLTIDDPIARITIGFLIKHVIDKLGIDKVVGNLIDDLLAPIIGKPEPRNLHDIMLDIAQRLSAMEGEWSQFMQDGGSQVEQAGKDWKAITSVAGNLAIAAFTIQAVVDPTQWASEISGTVGAAANDVAIAATKLFKG